MASVPEVGAQLTPHATAVLEHPRKGETWSCMASFQEVPGLFRAEAGLSHPAPPPSRPSFPANGLDGDWVACSPPPRPGEATTSGIPQLPAEVNWTPRPSYVIVQHLRTRCDFIPVEVLPHHF